MSSFLKLRDLVISYLMDTVTGNVFPADYKPSTIFYGNSERKNFFVVLFPSGEIHIEGRNTSGLHRQIRSDGDIIDIFTFKDEYRVETVKLTYTKGGVDAVFEVTAGNGLRVTMLYNYNLRERTSIGTEESYLRGNLIARNKYENGKRIK